MAPYRSKTFDYAQVAGTDFRLHPERYQVGRGEQGVLMVEPYKSELLSHWRFKTPEIARMSSKKLLTLFRRYKRAGDFVGMDMARKFLQMGYTRARRYANHASGRKYKKARARPCRRPATGPRARKRRPRAYFMARTWPRAKTPGTKS